MDARFDSFDEIALPGQPLQLPNAQTREHGESCQ